MKNIQPTAKLFMLQETSEFFAAADLLMRKKLLEGLLWLLILNLPKMVKLLSKAMYLPRRSSSLTLSSALKKIKVIRADLFDDSFTGLLGAHRRTKQQFEEHAARLPCEPRKLPISVYIGCLDFSFLPFEPTKIVELGNLKKFLENWDQMCIDAILAL